MIYNLDNEKQGIQLGKVMDFLKKRGIKQKEIASVAGISIYDIPNYKKGKVAIPDEFLETLHDEYNINIDYIRKGSNFLLDIPNLKLSNFESFVDDWAYVKDNNDTKFLHLTMDENFYNFLIEIASLKNNLTDKEYLSVLDNIAKQYMNKECVERDFVILPCSKFTEILETNPSKVKHLNEVIDILGLTSNTEHK